MNLESFQMQRAPAWVQLERLLQHGRSRSRRLTVEEVLELGRLYRSTAADLALARRRFPGHLVLERLEPLVLGARQVLYAERARQGSLREFLLRGYWREIRAQRKMLSLSLVAMFAPTLLTAVWAVHDPGAAIGLIPSAYRGAAAPHAHSLPAGLPTQAAFASSIYTHNIEVTFLVFAGGMAVGAGTLVLLAYNGVLLGTLAGLTIQSGTFSVFVRYIVPHGLLEALSCISVAGVAGLRLARALADPGLRPRAQALRAEARGGVQMILGTAPWLVVAGLTEGLVTPRALPVPEALAVGLTLATIYWSLVLTRGRAKRPAVREPINPAGP